MMVEQMHSALVELSHILSRSCGLRVGDDKLPLLAEVLSERMRVTGTRDFAVYLEMLHDDMDELAEIAKAISVSETYFLRDARQFAAFAKLLKERAARGLREVRVLSAGCSTGEEAYSVAITIRETLPDAALWNVSVLGADLNGRSLATARRACYTPWSLRETPEPIRQKYFTQEGSNYLLASEISEMVRFEQQNLAAPTSDLWRPESYDVVFLRNVLMYLRAEAARGIVENVARSMALDAHLFLGHAENLRGLSQRFQLIHAHEAFYYRLRSTELPECRSVRPSTQSLERTAATDWYSVINRASARIGALSLDSRAALAHDGSRQQEPMRSVEAPPRFDDTIERVISLIGLERFDDALCLLDTAADTERPQVGLLRAVLQFGAGKLEAALVECGRLLELDDLNAEAHFVTALCREHQGDADAACQHSRTASYLDNDFAMPHLQLGRLARRAGDLRTARRELELALDLLLRETPVRLVLFGGGFDRNALQNVCRGELAACGVDR